MIIENNIEEKNIWLKDVQLFSQLNEKEIEQILSWVSFAKIKKDDLIYSPGMEPNEFYILCEGKVKVYRSSKSGKEQIIRIPAIGDFLGELALFKDGVIEAYATAYTEVVLCTISYETFYHILDHFPSVGKEMLKIFADRLSRSENQTTLVTTEIITIRLAHFFLNHYEEIDGQAIFRLDIPKKDLASYIGSTPESFSRSLSCLIKEKMIIPHGDISYILNLEKLKNI
jgi:CRP/FNR family transcriptional regulator